MVTQITSICPHLVLPVCLDTVLAAEALGSVSLAGMLGQLLLVVMADSRLKMK